MNENEKFPKSNLVSLDGVDMYYTDPETTNPDPDPEPEPTPSWEDDLELGRFDKGLSVIEVSKRKLELNEEAVITVTLMSMTEPDKPLKGYVGLNIVTAKDTKPEAIIKFIDEVEGVYTFSIKPTGVGKEELTFKTTMLGGTSIRMEYYEDSATNPDPDSGEGGGQTDPNNPGGNEVENKEGVWLPCPGGSDMCVFSEITGPTEEDPTLPVFTEKEMIAIRAQCRINRIEASRGNPVPKPEDEGEGEDVPLPPTEGAEPEDGEEPPVEGDVTDEDDLNAEVVE